jgi:hypothetical protein
MTERRPHWDQELEQAVSAVLFDCYENGISEEQVYQVIAAVEDWQDRHTPSPESEGNRKMTPQQLLASANVFAGVTLVLQSDAFWVESLGVLLTAASAAYIGWAGASE